MARFTEEQLRDMKADEERKASIAMMASSIPAVIRKEEPELSYDDEIKYAFPSVQPGARPLGARILVQLKRIRKQSAGSKIILVEETTQAEKFNNMVGKVVEIGPLAFRKRDTMEPWPEGAWCNVDDYIRVPKWGGDRWEVPSGDGDDKIIFVVLNDHEIIAAINGDPLEMKAVY